MRGEGADGGLRRSRGAAKAMRVRAESGAFSRRRGAGRTAYGRPRALRVSRPPSAQRAARTQGHLGRPKLEPLPRAMRAVAGRELGPTGARSGVPVGFYACPRVGKCQTRMRTTWPAVSSAAASTHGAATPRRVAPRPVDGVTPPVHLRADECVDPNVAPPRRFPTSGIAKGGGVDGGRRLLLKRDDIVPLTANLRRVHFNVDKQVVRKLHDARDGLSHAIPGATMEQVLEAALDLLLERQARARGMVKPPRTALAAATGPLGSPPARPALSRRRASPPGPPPRSPRRARTPARRSGACSPPPACAPSPRAPGPAAPWAGRWGWGRGSRP